MDHKVEQKKWDGRFGLHNIIIESERGLLDLFIANAIVGI